MNKPVAPNDAQNAETPPSLKRGQSAQAQRDMRSKAALKANMARRKAQVLGKAQVSDKAQMRGKETEAADQGSPEDE